MSNKLTHIRNFAIIAHIDHGKSTLADRLIETCEAITSREMKSQLLDSMDIERERGITIKAQTVRLNYVAKDGKTYQLNLIDTPGHVDFSYEVSRSLAACEGSLLVVDASQGVEAQTLANVYLAIDNNHEIFPVLNKADLPAAEPEKVKTEIENIIGLDTSNSVLISAKNGLGIDDVLEGIVQNLNCPEGDENANLKALLIDSWYDAYLGVVILVRVYDGFIEKGMSVKFMSNDKNYSIDQVGVFTPKMNSIEKLKAGEVGYIICGIKSLVDTKIGDTITDAKNPTKDALEGFKPSKPLVFSTIFPLDQGDFNDLRDALSKLNINDSSFSFEVEHSGALGQGFRCGFLGLLHLEIIQERITREFNLEIITTSPSVAFKIFDKNGGEPTLLHNPSDMPDPNLIEKIEEPYAKATIVVSEDYVGTIMQLCSEKRGRQLDVQWNNKRAILSYMIPLTEIVFDFYDQLKSLSKGYASLDYEIDGYEEGDLVKVGILVNNEPVDALSFMTHRSNSETRGRQICETLKDLIPRQMFQIPIQAVIGGKVIARENVKAFRKDVTAKCYGGDVSRKRKLLEKQKEGKKRMRQFGKVEIPQNAFIEALKTKRK